MSQNVIQLKRDPVFNKATFLGIGPMSVNCVDATIELATEFQIPLLLIASRRQIDSEQFGGGYVNNWTTEAFCRYVQTHDKNAHVLLARDHGGPWQSDVEVSCQMTLQEAMSSAKDSYRADIAAGMSIIHIDPGRSISGEANASVEEFIERTKELMLFCYQEAEHLGKNIAIEVGTDEGLVGSASIVETEKMLVNILDFCKVEKLRPPSFMVVQTGTKVMEMRNVGILDEIIRGCPNAKHHSDLLKLIRLCNQHNVLLKEHNADYLSNETLSWHPQMGIDSANIAPEFGVIETKTFLKILKENHWHTLHEQTLDLAFHSGKWKKWMLDNTTATDYERAVIAGHYVFATEEFGAIKQEAQLKCERLGIDLNCMLKDAVKEGILRCLGHFGLVKSKRFSHLSEHKLKSHPVMETVVD